MAKAALPLTSGYPSRDASSAEQGEGWSAAEVFPGQGLNLSELVFLPGTFSPSPPNLTSRLTKNLKLNTPAVSLGKCTEEGMAMAMALSGGLGIIHRHMPIKEQATKVQRVKQYNSGFILNPACLAPRHTVEMAQKLQAELGCSGIPLTENGRVGGRLMGLVTKRDLEDMPRTATLQSLMNRDVVFAEEPVTLKEAHVAMQQAKVSKLPVLNKDQELVALICRGDMKQVKRHPHASRDANRQLMVAAAVSPNEPNAWDRVQALVGAGADLLSLETDEGVDHYVISFLKRTKEAFPGLDVVAGPVNSVRQASMLCNHGADAIRVGLAEGASASVLYDVSRTLRANYGTPVLADLQASNSGELLKASNSGELLKALLLGASTVSVDAMVSRCEEVPGDLIFREGVRVKLETSGSEDSAAVAMGVATHKIDGGSALSYIPIILNQLRRGLQDLGVSALAETSKALDQGLLRLERQLPRVVSFQAPKMYPITVNALHYT